MMELVAKTLAALRQQARISIVAEVAEFLEFAEVARRT